MCLTFIANAADFKIHGNVADVPNGSLIYLRLVGPPAKDIDSVKVFDGKFELKGSAPTSPVWATLYIKGKSMPLTDFYVEAGDIYVYGNLYECYAKGTKTNEEYLDFKRTLDPIYTEVYRAHSALSMNTLPAAKDSLDSELNKIENTLDKAELDYIRKYPASVLSLRLLASKSSHMTGENTIKTIALLDTSLQKTQQVADIKKYAQRLIACEEGTVAPDFSLETSTGKTFSLSGKKGKYILLDFWASWCAPCRNALPEVAILNEQYKEKNFEIIGVSLDKNINKWKQALAEEHCTWTQVCDPSGNVAKLFAVSAIPLMVIISPDGKILNRILQREDLPTVLAAILK